MVSSSVPAPAGESELISNESLNGCVFWASCALLAKLVLLGSDGGVITGTNEVVCTRESACVSVDAAELPEELTAELPEELTAELPAELPAAWLTNGGVFCAACSIFGRLVLLGCGVAITTGSMDVVCATVNVKAVELPAAWLKL